MTSYMRKSMATGVYSKNNVNQNFGYVGLDWPYTNTPYVRMWVDWQQLAPQRPADGIFRNPGTDPTPLPASKGGTVQEYVYAIDQQLRLARNYNLKIVLTFVNTPAWACNPAPGDTDPRLTAPSDLSNGSPYSAYIGWCILRWSPFNTQANGAHCDILEVCNEPNLFHPDPVSEAVAGRMMIIAQGWQAATGLVAPILAGPGTDDRTSSNAVIDSQMYTRRLLAYLRNNGFNMSSPLWAWSHHNYRDIKGTNGTVSMTRAQRVRDELKAANWRGWPFADSSAYLLLTEGGAHFNDAFDQLGAQGQVNRMTDAYNLARNDTPNQGEGLAMFTQYLDITDAGFDTGIRNSAAQERQLYSAWANFPQP